jgi:PLP dependent protein
MNPQSLKHHWEELQQELSGFKAKLLVVSKTRSVEEIRFLYQLGQRDFGENKVQELAQKAQELSDLRELRWHLIGHLQSNKINKLKSITGLWAIHSVDSLSLWQKLVQELPGVHCFLQVNTSQEEEKSGFESEDELSEVLALMKSQNHVPRGLMTMGTLRTEDQLGEARRCFQELSSMAQRLAKKHDISQLELSMGMSGDYLVARDLGSDWVRVGSKIFRDGGIR